MESSLRPLPSGLSGLLRDPPSQSTLGTSGNPLTGEGRPTSGPQAPSDREGCRWTRRGGSSSDRGWGEF